MLLAKDIDAAEECSTITYFVPVLWDVQDARSGLSIADCFGPVVAYFVGGFGLRHSQLQDTVSGSRKGDLRGP
jgi:hypothetical protein